MSSDVTSAVLFSITAANDSLILICLVNYTRCSSPRLQGTSRENTKGSDVTGNDLCFYFNNLGTSSVPVLIFCLIWGSGR